MTTTSCAQCGTAATAGATFCGQCGATLAAARRAAPGSPVKRRGSLDSRTLILVISGSVMIAVLGAVAYLLLRTERAASGPENAPVVQVQLGAPPATDSLVALAEEAETLSRQQTELTRSLQDAIARYQARSGGALPDGVGAELTAQQRAVLAERLKTEKMGTAALLQDLIAKDQQLQDLRQRLADVNGRLPDSVIAAEGQRHERIAMDYLTTKGLKTDEAYRLVSQSALTEPLLTGFRVFLLYDKGQFGTWVTQGNANRSPKALRDELARLANEERDTALKELEAANADRDDLRNMANAADKSLQATQADLKAMAAAATAQQAMNATLRYVIGSKSALVKSKIIDGSFRLLPVKSDGNAVDAAGPSTLPPIDPSVHGLKRVKRLTVVPGLVEEGTDYTVNDTDGFLSFAIVRPDRFARFAKYFVVVLE